MMAVKSQVLLKTLKSNRKKTPSRLKTMQMLNMKKWNPLLHQIRLMNKLKLLLRLKLILMNIKKNQRNKNKKQLKLQMIAMMKMMKKKKNRYQIAKIKANRSRYLLKEGLQGLVMNQVVVLIRQFIKEWTMILDQRLLGM